MRKLFLLLAISIYCSAWSQDTIAKPAGRTREESDREHFKFYLIFPNAIGNNVLSEANDGVIGIGTSGAFFRLNDLYFIVSYEFIQYKVTNPSLAGNVDRTNLANYGLGVLYKIPVAQRITLNAKVIGSYMSVTQRAGGSMYGRQYGYGIMPGFEADYKVGGWFRVFAGLNYNISFPETHTNEEYRSFFNTLQQLNIVAGIKF
jgi:hypothetical protein